MKIKGTEVGTGRPLICVPVLEKTKEEVIKEVEYLVKSDADMIEWRLDAFEHYTDYNEVREILQQIAPLLKKKLFLYTFRTAKQGGVVSVDRETLNDLHDLAAESECVDLIDLEFFEEEHAAKRIREIQKKGKKVVASHQHLSGPPYGYGVRAGCHQVPRSVHSRRQLSRTYLRQEVRQDGLHHQAGGSAYARPRS